MAGVPTAPAEGQFTRRPGLGAWLFFSPLLLWLLLFVVVPTLMIVAVSFATKDRNGIIKFASRDDNGQIVKWEISGDNYVRALDWKKITALPESFPRRVDNGIRSVVAEDSNGAAPEGTKPTTWQWLRGVWVGIDKTFSSFLWLKIFVLSIWYALLTTVICMVVGYPVAYFIGRAPANTRNVLLTLVMIPFWTSFLIRTYAWITLLSRDGLLNGFLMSANIIPEPLVMMYTPFAVVLGLVYNYLPFMILPIYTSVERLDNAMVEAAYDLGAGPVRAFSQVIIPLTKPGIVAGALLVFVPSIAMFAITTLMGGGKVPTIGEVIQKQFTTARNPPFGAALGTILLLIFVISLWMTRRQREE